MWASDRCRARHGGRRRRGDAGYVTAETAVALPTLVLAVMMLIWGLLATTAQIRCVDAARVGARAAARGEADAAVLTAVRRAAPDGAEVSVVRGPDTVRVAVAALFGGPGVLTRGLSVRVAAEAVAAREDVLPDALPGAAE
ncbi:TadE family type IV pilus minor pilin [Streptomyces sp. NPDC092296]|uniref:TadE family type IV pilus minor pilin n=1 Tax=Streptomyces sp. NPDC092296 TaxID=3366012 RepID=UPI003817BE61